MSLKYFSIDIETTGLSIENCQIIEFAAVFDDLKNPKPVNKLPKFHRLIKTGRVIQGEPFALAMHSEKLYAIANNDPKFEYCYEGELQKQFATFIEECGIKRGTKRIVINVAGKNFGSFDLQFLNKIGFGSDVVIKHRILDPSILFLTSDDDMLPNLDDCKVRAKIKNKVSHNALEDAIDVIEVLRKGLKKLNK
jgi:DNA polymerase III epsilon subunit-like protein